ncbi:hypothetical protein D3C74_454670 [compost metagenome]
MLWINDQGIMIDYELFRKYLRNLRSQHWVMHIAQANEKRALIIEHYVNILSKDRGRVELYELPDYQQKLLSDLPTIEI